MGPILMFLKLSTEDRQRQSQVGSRSETNLRPIRLPPSHTPACLKQGIRSHKVEITAGLLPHTGLGLRRLACRRKRKQGSFSSLMEEVTTYNLQPTCYSYTDVLFGAKGQVGKWGSRFWRCLYFFFFKGFDAAVLSIGVHIKNVKNAKPQSKSVEPKWVWW